MAAMNKSVLILFLLGCATSSVLSQCLTENDKSTMMSPDTKHKLTLGRYQFALDSLKKMTEIQSQENIFFSPHSLHQALSLAYYGAKGATEQNLKKALGIPQEMTKIDVLRYFAYEKSMAAAREENATSNYELKIANRLWITDAKQIRECMFDIFGSDLERTNFKADPEAARLIINEWVSNTTKNNIKDLIPEKAIDASTDLVLANAIYFKGLWQSRFDKQNSKKEVFFPSHGKAYLTTFMKQKGSFSHGISEALGTHILELPYKGDEISMFILLPPFVTARSKRNEDGSKVDSLHNLVQRITTSGFSTFKEILEDGMMARDVEVSIPKFAIEKSLPVNELLEKLGAGDVVSQNADLSGFLAENQGNLHLGDAVHRAKIELSEEGTTAAAATALFSFRSSRPIEPAVFKADHPFVYVIYDKTTKSILFAGCYRKPEDAVEAKTSA